MVPFCVWKFCDFYFNSSGDFGKIIKIIEILENEVPKSIYAVISQNLVVPDFGNATAKKPRLIHNMFPLTTFPYFIHQLIIDLEIVILI